MLKFGAIHPRPERRGFLRGLDKEKDYCENYIRREENSNLSACLILAVVLVVVAYLTFQMVKEGL